MRAWRYGESKDSFVIAGHKNVELDPAVVMMLLDEFRARGLIAAAIDYCWSIRIRALPEKGPLRRLWNASIGCRRAVGKQNGAVR